jgi:hypothetical protein
LEKPNKDRIFTYIKNKKIMIRKKTHSKGPVVIDLTGPDGNAFAVIR